MAKVEVQVEQWQERGIQVMVLLSFTMQLMLLVLAEFRRRMDSGVLRAMIWSAYMLADSMAIYTLGHLSVTSRSSDHELMAFWAPFLLVHLGGQDNITAYAIEDNRLWLRHLQALVVQVAAAAYILYESILVNTQALLWNAAVLVFVLGIVKYGERVWALKHAGASASGSKYQSFQKNTHSSTRPVTVSRDTEGLLQIAHLLLDVPKDMLHGPLLKVVVHLHNNDHIILPKDLYKVVEMQLSLMHDILYSKAEMIHTWYGLCIRVISPVFIAVAFVLFHMSIFSAGDHHYSKADVAITYLLLGGAVTLEMVSLLRAMFSKWPSVLLGKLSYDVKGEERRMWSSLARAVASIRRFVLPKRDGSRWWWSDSMGQHNLIDLCVRSKASRRSRIAVQMGVEDWWNTMVYSRHVPISATIKELVMKQVLGTSQRPREVSTTMLSDEGRDHIINSWGQVALRKWTFSSKLDKYVELELDESILVWHIATAMYLREHTTADDVSPLAKATEAISNYMLFLLATRPYMLPGSVSRSMYLELCYCLTNLQYSTSQDLISMLMPDYYGFRNIEDTGIRECIEGNSTLHSARNLTRLLVYPFSGPPARLEMFAEVWTEMLCYVGYNCSGYSHAKQLSNGGELLTIAALLVQYRRRNILNSWKSWPEAKEEFEGRAAIPGAASDLKATSEIILQPSMIGPMSASASRSLGAPPGEPRSPSYESKDQISLV